MGTVNLVMLVASLPVSAPILAIAYLLGVMSTADAAALRNNVVLVYIHKCVS